MGALAVRGGMLAAGQTPGCEEEYFPVFGGACAVETHEGQLIT